MSHTRELDEFEGEYGPSAQFVSADEASIALSDVGLPSLIFDYWKRFGFSKYLDGYFQFVDPRLYKTALDLWLAGTEFAAADHYYAVRMNAFGDMNVFGISKGRSFRTNVQFHALIKSTTNDARSIENGKGDVIVGSIAFQTLARQIRPDSDNYSIRLFLAAKEKLGVLGPNQIYAPVPAIPLGGQMRIEDLQIVDAPEYLAMVAELAPIRVMTMADLARIAYGEGAEKTLDGLLKK